MRFYLDTEFIENGRHEPIQLISLALVAQSGAQFYAVSSEFNPDAASEWVKENVLPHVGTRQSQPLISIARDVQSFIWYESGCHPGMGAKPEFWGYYADYDWVVFCQLFGRMVDLPKGFPMYCRDIKQWCDQLGNPELPKQASSEHNALSDALWIRDAYGYLERYALEPIPFTPPAPEPAP